MPKDATDTLNGIETNYLNGVENISCFALSGRTTIYAFAIPGRCPSL
jgi:hypothetical protein